MHFSQWSSLLFKPSVNADGNTMPNGGSNLLTRGHRQCRKSGKQSGWPWKYLSRGAREIAMESRALTHPQKKLANKWVVWVLVGGEWVAVGFRWQPKFITSCWALCPLQSSTGLLYNRRKVNKESTQRTPATPRIRE